MAVFGVTFASEEPYNGPRRGRAATAVVTLTVAADGKMLVFVLSTIPKLLDLFLMAPLAPSLHLGGSLQPFILGCHIRAASPAKESQMSPAANGQ